MLKRLLAMSFFFSVALSPTAFAQWGYDSYDTYGYGYYDTVDSDYYNDSDDWFYDYYSYDNVQEEEAFNEEADLYEWEDDGLFE